MDNRSAAKTRDREHSPRTIRRWLPVGPAIGFVIALLAVLLSAFFSYSTLRQTTLAGATASHALETQRAVRVLLSNMSDAETGQRGFLLTLDPQYLQPYENARNEFPANVTALRKMTTANADAQVHIDRVEQLGNAKLSELAETIERGKSNDVAGALAIVKTDRGKNIMDEIRAETGQVLSAEDTTFKKSQDDWQRSSNAALIVTTASAALLFFLIAYAVAMISRDYRAREGQMWIRNGHAGLGVRLQGDQRADSLSENALAYLCEYLDAQIGALYVAQKDGNFRRYAGFAIPHGTGNEVIQPGDGLLGQAAKANRVLRVRELPKEYVTGSSLGQGSPTELLIAPASVDGIVQAVIELGFLGTRPPEHEELLHRASEQIGIALRSAKDRSRLEELLEETQQQAEELQTQQEELRVSNEELEEQSRALKESQARMESQQTELEQINSQLEEQAQMLEAQRDDLSRAQQTLSHKATELERVSEYKSEFLANMSHELRTPLNSTLILAKLLADNKTGNLTAEQVKYAQTIASAGTDLLSLINDILDLAKVEAGKIEVVAEPVHLGRAVEALTKTFAPMAQQTKLAFKADVAPGTVASIDTDSRRLAQILRNLLSNAIKFTQKGEVSLHISSTEKAVSFVVHDTGVGIAPEQQQVIFEAFRQADGSTHRKFGGTGLGLSISRDLARLLGGDIVVQSALGEGSTFTLVLPLVYEPKQQLENTSLSPPPTRYEPAVGKASHFDAPSIFKPPDVEDDREQFKSGARSILVIEDDVRFAEILRDLSHEMHFQSLVAHTAKDGLAVAEKYRPSAILLDINLPDQSGLVVLDQLKRNPLLRHVPVHVVSIADYSREALERGAFGYALKPVKREELVSALQKLDAKLAQNMRRVLLIEDDTQQRANIRQLLGGGDIEIIDVSTAAAAIEQLGNSTFDCVILDLSLPDATGIELLEQMSEREDMSFPPVIIYTGQSLSIEEEQSLRRFSRSIILKGARSPERLLDEVMLFLHRVESNLPPESQRLLKAARDRDAAFEGRRILIVEDDVRNIFALSSVLEPMGAKIEIARNGKEAISALERAPARGDGSIDLVLMDIMMPEMDGFTAMREIRKRREWSKLPIIALTAKAMKDDQEKCLAAGANDYIAKPLDVEKLLSLVRVWMRK